MALVLGNNAYSTLAGSLTNVATTISLASGTGSRFPTVAAPDVLYCTLQNAAGVTEVVQVTAHGAGTDSLTVVRGQDGTTATTWNTGDIIEARLCRAALTALQSSALAGTSLLKGNGVLGITAATAGVEYLAPPSGTAMLKANGGGALANAVAGTDYAPATSGSSILMGNGAGGFSNAAAGSQYLAPPSGTSILKANSGGALVNAVSGSDYAPATSGSAILKGNGSGGFSSAAAGTDYQAPIGTISGLAKGNGANALTSAVAGTDYMAAVAPGASGNMLTSNGSAWVSSAAVAPLGVRQCAVSGPIDTSGLPTFMPATSSGSSVASQNISGSYPLVVGAANGFSQNGSVDYIGYSTSNLTWTGLTVTNGVTNFGYVDVASNGTMTTGVTTLTPVYQFGGTPSTTSGQATFNIQQMQMFVGNGSTAPQTYRVFLWEGTGNGANVASIVAYAYQGRYDSGFYSIANNTLYAKTHNLGVFPLLQTQVVSQNSDGSGWCVFMGVYGDSTGTNQGTSIVTCGRTSIQIRTGLNYVAIFTDSTGAQNTPSSGYARQILSRGW